MTGGLGFRIQNLWAYLAVHADGDEGISAFQSAAGDVWIPMIGADQQRIVSLAPRVESLVKASGIPHVLAQFGQRTDLERIEP